MFIFVNIFLSELRILFNLLICAMKKSTNKVSAEANETALLTLQMEKFCHLKDSYISQKYNVTPVEFRLLRFLLKEVTSTTKAMSKIMELSPGRITHLLNSLDSKKMIVREIDRKDRRSMKVSLTAEANVTVEKMISGYVKIHEEIFELVPTAQRNEVFKSMLLFFDAMKKWLDKLNQKV